MTKRKTLTPSSRVELDKTSRSYQYNIKETPFDFSTTLLHQFSNKDSISARLNQYKYSEELLDLKEALLDRFWQLAQEILTPLQLKVLTLYSDGYTQTEIAKQIGRNSQSGIHKAIFGSKVPKAVREVTPGNDSNLDPDYYGGAIKKLKKAFMADQTIQDLLKQIAEASEEIL